MSIQGLIEQEGDANDYVKDYCSHNYPQSSPNYDLAALMSHSGIASQVAPYAAEVAAAAAAGKSHVFGETNSGASSPSFVNTFLIVSSYARWRRYQPDIRSGTVDCGLCDAAGDHGHGWMNSTQPNSTVTDNLSGNLLPPGNDRKLPVLLVGTIHHRSPLLRCLLRNDGPGQRR